jgi:choline dehydrogenase-like flavoprotein
VTERYDVVIIGTGAGGGTLANVLARAGKRIPLLSATIARQELLPEHGHPGRRRGAPGGTCRFGADPRESVLNLNCKAQALDNLYVADASLLPASARRTRG